MIHAAIVLIAALSFAPSARAQGPFDPPTVAYVLCVTSSTKQIALETPPVAKDVLIERAFKSCGDMESATRKSLFELGFTQSAIDERFATIKKFIRQTAQDDIDRQRANMRAR